MSYIDIVKCIRPDRFLETRPPIYRGQERLVRDRLRVSQVDHHVYSRYTPCLTDLYLRVHPMPYSPDPKSFILDICRVNSHQFLNGFILLSDELAFNYLPDFYYILTSLLNHPKNPFEYFS
jgi:hypothetical protein